MSFDYIYSRELITDDGYDVNNKFRIDEEGNQIFLANEIESALPNKIFYLYCGNLEVKITFENELSEAEQLTLAQVVYAHKNNL